MTPPFLPPNHVLDRLDGDGRPIVPPREAMVALIERMAESVRMTSEQLPLPGVD